MKDFRILDEETFVFQKTRFYVLKEKIGQYYAIEVTSDSQSLGRLMITKAQSADIAFDLFCSKLNKIKKQTIAQQFIDMVFSHKSFAAAAFILRCANMKTTSFTRIAQWQAKKYFRARVVSDTRGDTPETGWTTINAYINKQKVGHWYGQDFGRDYKFVPAKCTGTI